MAIKVLWNLNCSLTNENDVGIRKKVLLRTSSPRKKIEVRPKTRFSQSRKDRKEIDCIIGARARMTV